MKRLQLYILTQTTALSKLNNKSTELGLSSLGVLSERISAPFGLSQGSVLGLSYTSYSMFPLSCACERACTGPETSAHKKTWSAHKCSLQKCGLHIFHTS